MKRILNEQVFDIQNHQIHNDLLFNELTPFWKYRMEWIAQHENEPITANRTSIQIETHYGRPILWSFL